MAIKAIRGPIDGPKRLPPPAAPSRGPPLRPQSQRVLQKKVPRQIQLPKGPPAPIYKKHLKKPGHQNQAPPIGELRKPQILSEAKKPLGVGILRHQKKQGLPADDRFFFPRRNKRKQKKQKKRPQGGYRRPKPQPSYKPKPTTTSKPYQPPKTTKQASYKPSPPSYDIEVTSYKPPQEVYKPSSNVDQFPDFETPNFPDLSSDFMPNFDFDFNKISCKSKLFTFLSFKITGFHFLAPKITVFHCFRRQNNCFSLFGA